MFKGEAIVLLEEQKIAKLAMGQRTVWRELNCAFQARARAAEVAVDALRLVKKISQPIPRVPVAAGYLLSEFGVYLGIMRRASALTGRSERDQNHGICRARK